MKWTVLISIFQQLSVFPSRPMHHGYHAALLRSFNTSIRFLNGFKPAEMARFERRGRCIAGDGDGERSVSRGRRLILPATPTCWNSGCYTNLFCLLDWEEGSSAFPSTLHCVYFVFWFILLRGVAYKFVMLSLDHWMFHGSESPTQTGFNSWKVRYAIFWEKIIDKCGQDRI